jgi:hypothetical protein
MDAASTFPPRLPRREDRLEPFLDEIASGVAEWMKMLSRYTPRGVNADTKPQGPVPARARVSGRFRGHRAGSCRWRRRPGILVDGGASAPTR